MSDSNERVSDIIEDLETLDPNDKMGFRTRLHDALEREHDELRDIQKRILRLSNYRDDGTVVGDETKEILKSLEWLLYGVDKEGECGIHCPYCGYRGDNSGCEVVEKSGLFFVHCLGPGCGVMGPVCNRRDEAIEAWRGITDSMIRGWAKEREHEKWMMQGFKGGKSILRTDCKFFKNTDICAKKGGESCPKECKYFMAQEG